jgi:hypothetical protein
MKILQFCLLIVLLSVTNTVAQDSSYIIINLLDNPAPGYIFISPFMDLCHDLFFLEKNIVCSDIINV